LVFFVTNSFKYNKKMAATCDIVHCSGTAHITLDPNVILQSPLVEGCEKVAVILSDSTPTGFNELYEWCKLNSERYDCILRSQVPYSKNGCLSPAEFILQAELNYLDITGRIRDVDLSTLEFEKVNGPFSIGKEDILPNEWPFPHTGSFRDVCGNAAYGDRVCRIPSLVNGVTIVQNFFLDWRNTFSPHELSVVAAAKFDLDYKTCRLQWQALEADPIAREQVFVRLPGLPPRMPRFYDKHRLAFFVAACCYGEPWEEKGSMDGSVQYLLPKGKIISGIHTNQDYIKAWVSARFTLFQEEFTNVNQAKEVQQKVETKRKSLKSVPSDTLFRIVKRDLISKIVERAVITAEEGVRLGFLDLPLNLKTAYLNRRLNGDLKRTEQLLHLTLKDLGPETAVDNFAELRVDNRDIVDLFAEYIVEQIECLYGITPANKREPIQDVAPDQESDDEHDVSGDSESDISEQQQREYNHHPHYEFTTNQFPAREEWSGSVTTTTTGHGSSKAKASHQRSHSQKTGTKRNGRGGY
jgi:hypothetical protein